MDGSLSAFDGIGLTILLVSGLLALVRGFVREALSVTAFVAASLATLWALPAFLGPARELIDPDWLAPLAIGAVIFLLVYLSITFVTSSLSNGLAKGDDVNVVDRTLGFAFGVVRGLVLLALGVIFMAATLGIDGQPPRAVTESRIYPLVKAAADALQTLAPSTSRIAGTDLLPEASPGAARDPIAETIRNDATSYGSRDRNRLDELIGSTTDDQDDDG
ncbi:CvpA family protein [Maricaulis salignorans]|uniref:Membrane protein required for colicin V production n=1 Tax=Maricaulis salignorans TaxID=144026 RepID=A0A1G9T628_9PROT|nr:CvpA family protein [Maricaulis salignorans]SDM43082.1 membrane protein required for colicin V production [Maricaulis salignorans]